MGRESGIHHAELTDEVRQQATIQSRVGQRVKAEGDEASLLSSIAANSSVQDEIAKRRGAQSKDYILKRAQASDVRGQKSEVKAHLEELGMQSRDAFEEEKEANSAMHQASSRMDEHREYGKEIKDELKALNMQKSALDKKKSKAALTEQEQQQYDEITKQISLKTTELKTKKTLRLGKSYKVTLKNRRSELKFVEDGIRKAEKKALTARRPLTAAKLRELQNELNLLVVRKAALQEEIDALEGKEAFEEMMKESSTADSADSTKALGDASKMEKLKAYQTQLESMSKSIGKENSVDTLIKKKEELDQITSSITTKEKEKSTLSGHIKTYESRQLEEEQRKKNEQEIDTIRQQIEIINEMIEKKTEAITQMQETVKAAKEKELMARGVKEETQKEYDIKSAILFGSEDGTGLQTDYRETVDLYHEADDEIKSLIYELNAGPETDTKKRGIMRDRLAGAKRRREVIGKRKSELAEALEQAMKDETSSGEKNKTAAAEHVKSVTEQEEAEKKLKDGETELVALKDKLSSSKSRSAKLKRANQTSLKRLNNAKKALGIAGLDESTETGKADIDRKVAASKRKITRINANLSTLRTNKSNAEAVLEGADLQKSEIEGRLGEIRHIIELSNSVSKYKANKSNPAHTGNKGDANVTEDGLIKGSVAYEEQKKEKAKKKRKTLDTAIKKDEAKLGKLKKDKAYEAYRKSKEESGALRAVDRSTVSDSQKLEEELNGCPSFTIGGKKVIAYNGMLLSTEGVLDPEKLSATDQKEAKRGIEKDKIVRGIRQSPAFQYLVSENLEQYQKYNEDEGSFEPQEDISTVCENTRKEMILGAINLTDDESELSQMNEFVSGILEAVSDYGENDDGFIEEGSDIKWKPFSDMVETAFEHNAALTGYASSLLSCVQCSMSLLDAHEKSKNGDHRAAAISTFQAMGHYAGALSSVYAATATFLKDGPGKDLMEHVGDGAGIIGKGFNFTSTLLGLKDTGKEERSKGDYKAEAKAQREAFTGTYGEGIDLITDICEMVEVPLVGDVLGIYKDSVEMLQHSIEAEELRKQKNQQYALSRTLEHSTDKNDTAARIMRSAAHKTKQGQVEETIDAVNSAAAIVSGVCSMIDPVIGRAVGLAISITSTVLDKIGKLASKCIIGRNEAKEMLTAPNVLGKVKYDKSVIGTEEFNDILREEVGIRDLQHVYKALKITDAIDMHMAMRASARAGVQFTTVDTMASAIGFADKRLYKNVSLEDVMEKTGYSSGVGDWKVSLQHCMDGSYEQKKGVARRAWANARGWARYGYVSASVSESEKKEIAKRNAPKFTAN